jgi:hypothetical protein
MGLGVSSMGLSMRLNLFLLSGSQKYLKSLGGYFQVYLRRDEIMSQKKKVLEYLEHGNPITPAKAQVEFNVWRLADVIYKLKKDGHKISTRIKRTFSGKFYAEYTLQEGGR